MLNVIWEKSFLILYFCYCFQILQSLKIVLIYFLCETFGFLLFLLLFARHQHTFTSSYIHLCFSSWKKKIKKCKAEIYSCWTKKLFHFFIINVILCHYNKVWNDCMERDNENLFMWKTFSLSSSVLLNVCIKIFYILQRYNLFFFFRDFQSTRKSIIVT